MFGFLGLEIVLKIIFIRLFLLILFLFDTISIDTLSIDWLKKMNFEYDKLLEFGFQILFLNIFLVSRIILPPI